MFKHILIPMDGSPRSARVVVAIIVAIVVRRKFRRPEG
jgi:hypothetical protein